MARQAQRVGDYTGTQKANLAKEHAEEQKAAASRMAVATAEADVLDQEPVELTRKDLSAPAPEEPQEVQVREVEVQEEQVQFRVNETLESVTIGHGNHYDFEEGRQYRAPRSVYNHLEEKGLIWH